MPTEVGLLQSGTSMSTGNTNDQPAAGSDETRDGTEEHCL